ncbi:MAG: response regulator [Frankiales bacterium]|nr:response regulator [Frankiales bacterium]
MSPDTVIYIIDDDRPVLDSLAFLLRAAGYQVESFASAVTFLEMPLAETCCVVTDVRMPEMNGFELLRQLSVRPLPPPVVVMTGHGDVPLAVEAMRCGAFDFLEKPFDDEVLLKSVSEALAKGRSGPTGDSPDPVLKEKIDRLTVREFETLQHLVRGRPNKIIAHELGISIRTVEVHRANVMSKMAASSLSELVRMALLAGLDPI